MALRIAAAHRIPVMNLGAMSPREACERLLAIRRAADPPSFEPETSERRANARQGRGRCAPVPVPGAAPGTGDPTHVRFRR